jgi:hypothetical protein
MPPYTVLLSRTTYQKASAYLARLRAGQPAGNYLQAELQAKGLDTIHVDDLLELLLRTKRPQIFAESAVCGDGSDWTLEELSILGDTSIAVPVTVFDNGAHQDPQVHPTPFTATLLFTPGALLRNGMGATPADWDEVVRAGDIDPGGYFRLYERRLLPPLHYANHQARQRNQTAFVTIPGLGCGQFAGEFRGRLGEHLKEALARILEVHGATLPHIRAVYYDPYSECRNERRTVGGIQFLVRPLTQGNQGKSQLCLPSQYAETGDDFEDCQLFSFVAWDHVSWPGNDFYGGARATDDGVKAAATNAMAVLTGFEGTYNPQTNQYDPPAGYATWGAVVLANQLQLSLEGNLRVYP